MLLKVFILYITSLAFSNAVKVCDFKLCNFEGECLMENNNVPSCKCIGKTFFQGPNCKEEINNCVPNPCKNSGTCQNYIGHYNCKCPQGYSGQNCKMKYDKTFTGFHLHYNRLAEVGKEQVFLLTLETLGEARNIFVIDLYINDYVIDGFIYANHITKFSKAFESSDDLITLAKRLGLRNANKMPYKKGFYHLSKGTFWHIDTQQLKMVISNIENKQFYYNDKMLVNVYKPNWLSCVPEVEILNCNRLKPSLHIDVTQYNVLTPIVKKRCAKDSQMVYKWTVKNTLGTVKFHDFGQSRKSILKIKPYDLSFNYVNEYEQKYLIQADVTEDYKGKSFKTTARCYIETDSKPVRSIITGGPKREVDEKQPFELDGSHSRDYYFAPERKQYLQYHWSCTTNDKVNDFCNTFGKRDAKVFVDASLLTLGKSYSFTLKITSSVNDDDDDGSDTAVQVITVIKGKPLYIDILCVRNCAKNQYITEKIIHLEAKCLNCPKSEMALNYIWKLNGNQPATTDTNNTRFIFTPTNSMKPIIVELQLKHGMRSGLSQLQLIENLPPSGGSCTIAPTSGKEFETEFEINCANYEDADLPLRYEYKAPQMIFERCSNPRVKLRLSTLSNLQIEICDAYKACTTTNVAVQVSAMDLPQDVSALDELLKNDKTSLRRFIDDGKIRKLMVLTSVILKARPTLEMASVVLKHLNNLEILTLLEAEQITTITTNLLKALKPLDNKKAALLAKLFKKMSDGYHNILQDGEVRELDDEPYKLLTEELAEILKEFSESLEEIQEVHTANVQIQQETDDLLAEKYPDFAKFDITVLPRIENWLQAAIELNKCMKCLGNMATNMHEPAEEALLINRDDLSIETFAFEGNTQREIISKDGTVNIKLNSGVISELKALFKSEHLLVQIISTPQNTYWWYPDEQPISTGVLYFNIYSKRTQKAMNIDEEIKLKNAFELSLKLQQSKQINSGKVLKGYVETSLDMPIFETVMPINSVLVIQFQTTAIDLKVMLRLGVRPRGYMVKKSATLITEKSTDYQNLILINNGDEVSMGYLAVLAANDELSKRANFTFTAKLRECLNWNFRAPDPAWFTTGCIPVDVSNNTLRCRCQHLSTFAGKVKPTTVQPALGERQLLERVPINWPMVLFYVLLLCILAFLLWRAYNELLHDPKDRLIIEIRDKEAEKDFDIVVHFHTGGQWNAGTTANLKLSLITLHQGLRTFIIYQNPADPNITTSSTCSVHLPISSDKLLTNPLRISICHDGAGRYPSWYCNGIDVENIKMQTMFYADVRQWISTKPQTFEAVQVTTLNKITQVKFKFENLMNNWFAFQPFTGPWRSGTAQLNRSERTMIWIIKVAISICIIACYFGRTTLENYEAEREKFYSFNTNILELLVLCVICYFVGIIVQILLIYVVLAL